MARAPRTSDASRATNMCWVTSVRDVGLVCNIPAAAVLTRHPQALSLRSVCAISTTPSAGVVPEMPQSKTPVWLHGRL
jgi:hypothetical protein